MAEWDLRRNLGPKCNLRIKWPSTCSKSQMKMIFSGAQQIELHNSTFFRDHLYHCLQVLIPPTGNVIDVLALNSNLTSLVRLLKTAGLADELQGPGPFTVFAPNDEAFRSMRKENLQKLERDPQILKTFLKNHIVQGA